MIIPFLAVATVLGAVVVLGTKWRRHSWRTIPALPRKPWLLLFAIVPQFVWTHWVSHLGSGAMSFVWLLPASYLPVFLFIAFNVRYPWARVVAVGVSLNVAVMLGNGGTMPMPARFVGNQTVQTNGSSVRLFPGSKDRIADSQEPTLLAPLEDQYVVTLPGGARRLTSVGDFVSLGGAFFGLLSSL